MSTQPDRPDNELSLTDFVSEFERLTGVRTLHEEQHADTDRVVDESVTQDVKRATEDGHDFGDCGGDD